MITNTNIILPLSANEFYMKIIGTVNASWNIFFQKELSFLSSSVDAFKLETETVEYYIFVWKEFTQMRTR